MSAQVRHSGGRIALAAVPVVLLLVAAWLALGMRTSKAQDVQPSATEEVNALQGTSFVYKGQLIKAGVPVTAVCDFQFKLFDSAVGGLQFGPTNVRPGVAVSSGNFSVILNFGKVFTGATRYLQTEVKCPPDLVFTILSPRQLLYSVPYAQSLSPNAIISNTYGNALNTLARGANGIGLVSSATGAGGIGVYGSSATSYGVYGRSSGSVAGVFGINTVANGEGVVGVASAAGGTGVYGSGTAYIGVWGSSNSLGVYGAGGAGTGVSGVASIYGVRGSASSASGRGVYGAATGGTGIGVLGQGSVGVYGTANKPMGIGVYGNTGGMFGARAGYFLGPVHVQGLLTKAAGAFKIDHPLDPANKYLNHSFVESPDMMNIYNGNVSLDANGRATVALPAYFEALNMEFRYQLTPIGAAMPDLHIATEIANNSFTIAGGKAGQKVSWQVTGIRHDPFADANRILVEEEKQPTERGRYLFPEGYGQPAGAGIGVAEAGGIEATSVEAAGTDVLPETIDTPELAIPEVLVEEEAGNGAQQ